MRSGNDMQVRLPGRVRAGEPVRAGEYNKLIDALEVLVEEVRARTLRPSADLGWRRSPGGVTGWLKGRRGPSSGGAGHQWRITVAADGATWTATVAPGVTNTWRLTADADSPSVPTPTLVSAWHAGEVLTGLADDTTYGIWLAVGASAPETANSATHWANPVAADTIAGEIGAGALLVIYDVGPGTIEKDATNTAAADVYTKVAGTIATGYVYLGKVTIAGGVVSLEQWQTGPITLPAVTYTHGVLSEDANQSLTVGADGGVFYDEP